MLVRDKLVILLRSCNAREAPNEQTEHEDVVIGWDPQDVFQEKVHAVDTKTDEAVE